MFDPITMENHHRSGDDVPAWLLDTDYNGMCFHVSQAFFPRTSAWDNLKKALNGEYDDSVWDHLAGTTSAPFEAGEHGQVAVKVIDDRGNELLVVKKLSEAKMSDVALRSSTEPIIELARSRSQHGTGTSRKANSRSSLRRATAFHCLPAARPARAVDD